MDILDLSWEVLAWDFLVKAIMPQILDLYLEFLGLCMIYLW